MDLLEIKFLEECTRTNEQVENLEETTLVLWDMLLASNVFEEEKEEKYVLV